MVDANAAYTLNDADHLARLDAFNLMMIEQPLDYDDVTDHVELQERLKTPICLDESIHTVRIARDAIAARACKIINIKPGRVGGHRESIRLHDLCAESHIPVWHGGMLETGIGRAHNIHLASLPNFTLPGDIAASKRYYSPDLIEPAIEVAPDGTIAVPDGPGIGVNIVQERVDRATERTVTIDRSGGAGMTQRGFVRVTPAALLLLFISACASTTAPAVPEVRPRPQRTFDEKMLWILRLEEDRILELPAPPAPPPPPPPAAPARGRTAPAAVVPEPPQNPDLIALLKDDDPRIRRRAALAIGRTRSERGGEAADHATDRHRPRGAADGRVRDGTHR